MYRQTQLWCLSSLLFHLPFCIKSTGYTTIPSDDSGTKPRDNGTRDNNNILGSRTTILPKWTNSESSASLVTETTHTQRNTPDGILYVTGGDDYYDDDSEETSLPPPTPAIPCPYDHCRHMEPPCKEIQMRKDGTCLCPGLTASTIRPNTPRLGQIVTGDTNVDLRWCSPMSAVHGYRVLYGSPGGLMETGPVLNASYRFYSIGDLLPDTSYRVCVVAFNKAGESLMDTEEGNMEEASNAPGPCRVVHTTSIRKLYIYIGLGVIALTVLLILLSIIVYFLCRKRAGSKVNEWEEMEYPF